MNRSIVRRLIAKDLYLYRWLIAGAVVAGIVAILVSPFNSIVGPILFMTSIIAVGIFIVIYGILKEHQDKSVLFVLSLPISAMQYTTAKVLSALIAFLIPSIVLTVLVVVLTAASESAPDGNIPFTVVMMAFFLGNFCILIAVVVITNSERWAVAGILGTNLSVSLFVIPVRGMPGIGEFIEGPIAVWSPAILTILGIEAVVIVLSLVFAFLVQSRKRDFV